MCQTQHGSDGETHVTQLGNDGGTCVTYKLGVMEGHVSNTIWE